MDLMPLFFRLFKCQDKTLRQLIFRHIIAGMRPPPHATVAHTLIENLSFCAKPFPH